jgi:hypothetical protein
MVRTPIIGHFDAQFGKASYAVEVMLSEVFRLHGPQYEIKRKSLPTKNSTLEDAPHLQDAASQAAIQAQQNQRSYVDEHGNMEDFDMQRANLLPMLPAAINCPSEV